MKEKYRFKRERTMRYYTQKPIKITPYSGKAVGGSLATL